MKKWETPKIAKDGKSYDIVNASVDRALEPNEVEIIQIMIFDGKYFGGERRKLVAKLDEETSRKADNLIITTTLVGINNVKLCARFIGDPEESEICKEHENDRVNPETGNNLLKELINEITKRGRENA